MKFGNSSRLILIIAALVLILFYLGRKCKDNFNNSMHDEAVLSTGSKSDKASIDSYLKCHVNKDVRNRMLNDVKQTDTWITDSGANIYLTNNPKILSSNIRTTNTKIALADDQEVCATMVGDGTITRPLKDGGYIQLNLHEVYYSPEVAVNLISVSCLIKDNNLSSVSFTAEECTADVPSSGDTVVLGWVHSDGLWYYPSQ
jgi:hypothetical protein